MTKEYKYFIPLVINQEADDEVTRIPKSTVRFKVARHSGALHDGDEPTEVMAYETGVVIEGDIGYPTKAIAPDYIPVRTPRRGLGYDQAFGSHNWLVVMNTGLHVEPLRGYFDEVVENPTESNPDGTKIVTVDNSRKMFKDCDGRDVKSFDESTGDFALVTCDILMKKIAILQAYVDSLVDEFRKQSTTVFDGAGATTDIIGGGTDAGLDQSNDVAIPIEVKVGLIAPDGTGADEQKLRVPVIVAQKANMTAGQVYALDVFYVNGGNKIYQGTFYYTASGPGWEYGNGNTAVVAVSELSNQTMFMSREKIVSDYNFTLRALRAGESATGAKPMRPPYGVGI